MTAGTGLRVSANVVRVSARGFLQCSHRRLVPRIFEGGFIADKEAFIVWTVAALLGVEAGVQDGDSQILRQLVALDGLCRLVQWTCGTRAECGDADGLCHQRIRSTLLRGLPPSCEQPRPAHDED